MKDPIIIVILALILLISTTDKASGNSASFAHDSLQTSVISIEVVDFDLTVSSTTITAQWPVLHSQDRNELTLFLDSLGRTSFTVRENIVRDYTLIYGGTFLDILVRPGEDLHVRIVRDTAHDRYVARTPGAPLTEQAAELLALLEAPSYPVRDSLTRGIDDLDSLLAINEGFAEQRRRRLRELRASDKYTDSLLLRYADSYIDHQVRTDLNFRVSQEYQQTEADSILQKHQMPNAGKPFRYPTVFHSAFVDDLHYEQMAVTSLAFNSVSHLPVDKRISAYYAASVRFIDSLYTGFLRDAFLSRVYSLQLTAEQIDTTVVTDAECFIKTTPYPILREPLLEQLRILNGEVAPVDLYAQQLLQLPAGADNPIPAILKAHAGKVIVLDFWATWCAPCIIEMKDRYPAFVKRYDPEKVVVVFLASNSPEHLWRDQISKLEFSAVHLRTTREQSNVTSVLFGISGIPHHTVFDQRGKLVRAKADGPGYGLEKIVDELLER